METGTEVCEFVGCGSWSVASFTFVVGELGEELSELLGIDVEVASCLVDEVFFDFGCKVEEFVSIGVEPVVGVGGFAPEVEGAVVDGDPEFFVGVGEI